MFDVEIKARDAAREVFNREIDKGVGVNVARRRAALEERRVRREYTAWIEANVGLD